MREDMMKPRVDYRLDTLAQNFDFFARLDKYAQHIDIDMATRQSRRIFVQDNDILLSTATDTTYTTWYMCYALHICSYFYYHVYHRYDVVYVASLLVKIR